MFDAPTTSLTAVARHTRVYKMPRRIQKRLGPRLRNLQKEVKNLGGRGKWTEKLIDELSVYYELDMRRNTDSVENMYKEIYATLYQTISTDEKPQQDRCPVGEDSWRS